MPVKIVTAPASGPVTLAEMKSFARISTDADDAVLTAFLAVGTAKAEHFSGQRFVSQTIDLYLDGFPGAYGEILIPGPVQSITSVTYMDTGGETQTMDADDYRLDNVSNPARLTPAYDTEWPETQSVTNSVIIRAVVGDDVDACPDAIKTYIMAYARHLYDQLDGDPDTLYLALLATDRREFAL